LISYSEHYFRDYEYKGIAGYTMALLGVSISVLLFRPDIALATVLILYIGDPISGLVSSGEMKRVKSLRALSAMLLTSLAAGSLLV